MRGRWPPYLMPGLRAALPGNQVLRPQSLQSRMGALARSASRTLKLGQPGAAQLASRARLSSSSPPPPLLGEAPRSPLRPAPGAARKQPQPRQQHLSIFSCHFASSRKGETSMGKMAYYNFCFEERRSVETIVKRRGGGEAPLKAPAAPFPAGGKPGLRREGTPRGDFAFLGIKLRGVTAGMAPGFPAQAGSLPRPSHSSRRGQGRLLQNQMSSQGRECFVPRFTCRKGV